MDKKEWGRLKAKLARLKEAEKTNVDARKAATIKSQWGQTRNKLYDCRCCAHWSKGWTCGREECPYDDYFYNLCKSDTDDEMEKLLKM